MKHYLKTCCTNNNSFFQQPYISCEVYEESIITIFTKEKTDLDMLSNWPRITQLVSGIVGFESTS